MTDESIQVKPGDVWWSPLVSELYLILEYVGVNQFGDDVYRYYELTRGKVEQTHLTIRRSDEYQSELGNTFKAIWRKI